MMIRCQGEVCSRCQPELNFKEGIKCEKGIEVGIHAFTIRT